MDAKKELQEKIQDAVISEIDNYNGWYWQFEDGWEKAENTFILNKGIDIYDVYVEFRVRMYVDSNEDLRIDYLDVYNLSIDFQGIEMNDTFEINESDMTINIEKQFN